MHDYSEIIIREQGVWCLFSAFGREPPFSLRHCQAVVDCGGKERKGKETGGKESSNNHDMILACNGLSLAAQLGWPWQVRATEGEAGEG